MLIKLERDRLKTRAQIQREMKEAEGNNVESLENKFGEAENIQQKTMINTKTK